MRHIRSHYINGRRLYFRRYERVTNNVNLKAKLRINFANEFDYGLSRQFNRRDLSY